MIALHRSALGPNLRVGPEAAADLHHAANEVGAAQREDQVDRSTDAMPEHVRGPAGYPLDKLCHIGRE